MKRTLTLAALVLLAMAGILASLLKEAAPALSKFGLGGFDGEEQAGEIPAE